MFVRVYCPNTVGRSGLQRVCGRDVTGARAGPSGAKLGQGVESSGDVLDR